MTFTNTFETSIKLTIDVIKKSQRIEATETSQEDWTEPEYNVYFVDAENKRHELPDWLFFQLEEFILEEIKERDE